MLTDKLKNYDIILASQSPRRQHLLKELGLSFQIKTKPDLEEVFPNHLKAGEIPLYLAKFKADAFDHEIGNNTILITADTIVWLNGELLGKPTGKEDAKKMIARLSGQKHTVYTGVCITTAKEQRLSCVSSDVYFKKLTSEEIEYYVEKFSPLDKAGAYGIQEWLGYIGIEKIDGSFYNVMGLPVQKVYDELLKLDVSC